MKPTLLDGNAVAESILNELREDIARHPDLKPKVAFLRVGEDPASVSYVTKKKKTAESLGITSHLEVFPADVEKSVVVDTIHRLNADPSIHGILLQAPLPSSWSEVETFREIAAEKDVDGFHTENLGKLAQEDETGFVSCTPAGVIEILKRHNLSPRGKEVVVVGRSLIVGKPLSLLLVKKGEWADATVTVCHSRTPDLGAVTRRADIVIAAMGRPHAITADMVKEGAVVIDVGINRIRDDSKKSGFRLVGDVDFANVAPKCSAITPVPGGVGPMTVAMLMKNTWQACRQLNGL